jgi:Cu/Ag efflux protein CusF
MTLTRFVAVSLMLFSVTLVACRREPGSNAPPSDTAKPSPAAEKKGHAFRGKVEKVDLSTKTLTVAGENVEGWMSAMTMVYQVDKPEVLDRISAGDQITATVYDGDFGTLHGVAVSTAKPSK